MSISFRAVSTILENEAPCGFVCRRDDDVIRLYPSSTWLVEDAEDVIETTLEALLKIDDTLAQIQNLPPMTQAWRWEERAEFEQARLPTGPTWFYEVELKPAPDHPDGDRIGFALLNAWIRIETEAEARKLLEQEISTAQMRVLEMAEAEQHSADDYEPDDPSFGYFDQAQLDGEVFVYHNCPRYPVFQVSALIEHSTSGQLGKAHYFLCGDSVCEEEEDVYDPEFWNEQRQQHAHDGAREALQHTDYSLVRVVDARPIGRDDLTDAELIEAYDLAEEEECSLVILLDEDSPPAP